MKKHNIILGLAIVLIPTAYAVLVRLIFGIDKVNEIFGVMTLAFLFLSPSIVGALTMYLSSVENGRNTVYRIFVPWIPIFIFLGITLAFSLEGWACWMMALPLFLIASS